MSVDFQWTRWRYIPEGSALHKHHCENLKSYRLYSCSVFESLSIIGQCLVNMNILAPRIWALQMALKEKNHDFTKNGSKLNLCNYRDFPKYNCIGGISRKVMVRLIVAETHMRKYVRWLCIPFFFKLPVHFIRSEHVKDLCQICSFPNE
jgi:hypothetical protein